MSDIIEARGLGKGYGDVVALDGLDLAVPSVTIRASLGPHCAAKHCGIHPDHAPRARLGQGEYGRRRRGHVSR